MSNKTREEIEIMSKEEINLYWKNAMENRMDEFSELCRLSVVFKSYFLQCRLYDVLHGRGTYDTEDYKTFWDSKRPYGNKCVPKSIAFSLGWDKDRPLCYRSMPEFVEDEAMKLHYKLLDFVNKDWERDEEMFFTGCKD